MHQDWQAKYAARVVRTSVLILSLIVTSCASIPPLPSTAIVLADFDATRGVISAVTDITPHAGYNNQPAFSADGRTVYYVDDVEGATDIVRYDRTTGARTRMTQTPEAEFSPTPMPDGRSLSAVRVGKPRSSGNTYTESQQLWRYDSTGRAIAPIIGMRRIGYHCWTGDGMVAVFVVGDEEQGQPHTLRVVDLASRQSVTVASYIGRTLRMSPQNRLTYVDKSDSSQWVLMTVAPGEERGTSVLPMPRGSEDFVWLADGRVLMSSADGLLIAQQQGTAWTYTPVSGVLPLRGRIGRIAMSPDGRTLALVVTREPLPSK